MLSKRGILIKRRKVDFEVIINQLTNNIKSKV